MIEKQEIEREGGQRRGESGWSRAVDVLGMPKGSNGAELRGPHSHLHTAASQIFVDLCTASFLYTCISVFIICLGFVLWETRHSKKNFNRTLTLHLGQ